MRILSRHNLTALTCLLFALPAYAQLPSLLPVKPVASTAVPAAPEAVNAKDPQQELTDAQGRLRDAQDALKRIQDQLDQKTLAVNARNELLKQFNLRQTLADRYAQQIDYLKQLQVLDQKIVDATQQRDSWVPPAGTAPWSVVDGDVVRNEMLVYAARITQLGKESAALSEQIVSLSREKADSESRLRQLQEKADKNSDADRAALEDVRGRLALQTAVLVRTDLERRVKDKDRALLEVRRETASRTWDYFGGRFVLPPEVLATAKADLQGIIDRDRDAELKALARAEAAMARLNKAQSAFQRLDQTKASARQIADARAALDIAQADESAARSEVDRLRQLIEIGGYGLQVWDARAIIYGNPRPDATRLDDIVQRVRVGLIRIRQARDFLQQSLTTREQEAFDLREALLGTKSPLDQKVIAARLASANAQTDSARSILAALDKFEQHLTVIQSELGVYSQDRTLGERLIDYWQRLVGVSKKIWQYELFTVDDVLLVDNREVKTTRGVTIGKSVGAIGILIFGFLLVSWLIRSAIGLAERRIGLKSSVATQIRRWLTVVATATLIILSFNLVQIPLSVFAFLGGALAIGAGFGTQNLIKNLISGLMLLVERPIRMGDLVEVDGIKGRVTSIGIRFSTIHSADGVDTLIPNSELVEKKLVNWTYSNPDARREIRVGVAYGTDPVQVKNLIKSAALAHPDVMTQPEPTVVLDDLGDSALMFSLRYWIRLGAGTDGREVDSDLRCEILDKLAAAGIDVPYPQRDVRLQMAQPLTVALMHPDAETKGR